AHFLRAKEWALKALDLDETRSLGEAYAALGIVKTFFEYDWPGAEEDFRKAIQFAPEHVDGHHFYGHYLEAMGRSDEAVASFQRAIRIEPSTEILSVELANIYFHGRRFQQAAEQCRKVLAADPNALWAYEILASVRLAQGDPT